MKRRKFGDGGEIPPGGRFDSDTYARARKWIADGSPEPKDEAPAKASSKPATKPAPKSTPKPEPKAAPSPAPAQASSSSRAEIPKDTTVKAPASTGQRSMSDLERNVLNTAAATSGLAGMRPVLAAGKKIADAASSGSRAIAKSETPVKFLGASGRKNITPKEAIGTTDKPRLTADAGDRAKQLGGPKALPAPKAAADTPKLPAPKEPVKTPTPRKPEVKEKVSRTRANPRKPSVSPSGSKSLSGRDRTSYDDMPGVEYKKGGAVRGTGCATKGKKFSGVF